MSEVVESLIVESVIVLANGTSKYVLALMKYLRSYFELALLYEVQRLLIRRPCKVGQRFLHLWCFIAKLVHSHFQIYSVYHHPSFSQSYHAQSLKATTRSRETPEKLRLPS